MSIERKWELGLFCIFALLLVPLLVLTIPNGSIQLGALGVAELGPLQYGAFGLILAFVLALIIGGELDKRDLLVRYGIRPDRGGTSDAKVLGYFRFAALVYLLSPILLLIAEIGTNLRPLTTIAAFGETYLSAIGAQIVWQIYLLVYGLFLTLLAIDMFLSPLTSKMMREEAKGASKNFIATRTYNLVMQFGRDLQQILIQNRDHLGGSRQNRAILNQSIAELTFLKKAVDALNLSSTERQQVFDAVTAIEETLQELTSYVAFLDHYKAGDKSAGRKPFRKVKSEDIRESLGTIVSNFNDLFPQLAFDLSAAMQADLRQTMAEIETGWKQVQKLALQHYGLEAN